MQSHARVVVVGGGIAGVNIIYALTKRSWADVVLLERTQLTAGSTWHAAGLVPIYSFNYVRSQMTKKSVELYRSLAAEVGYPVGWRNCGQLRVANTRDRMDEYLTYAGLAEAQGIQAHILTPSEVRNLWPLFEGSKDMIGGLHHPEDGHIAPADLTQALAKCARDRGAKIYLHTEVTGFESMPNGEWKVKTNRGEITCEHVVTATGNYSRQTGAMVGSELPAIPIVHQYWVTEAIPEIQERHRSGLKEMPILRDETINGYIREEGDGLMFGPYEPTEKMQIFAERGVPKWFGADLLPEDFESVEEHWAKAMEYVPVLKSAGIKRNVRGPFQMTPDHVPLIGPSGLHNFWLAEGVGGAIVLGGGLGHHLAAWIMDGDPGIDMSEFDPRRYPQLTSRRWTCTKVKEQMGTNFGINFPGYEWLVARPAKTAPSYDLLSTHGAVWGSINGWEVPNWYAPKGVEAKDDYSFRNTLSSTYVGEEARAVRESVGLIELTASAKFEISGSGAHSWLESILANGVPKVIGRVAIAHLLSAKGTVRSQFTVVRLAEQFFYLIGASNAEAFDFRALSELLPRDHSVILQNVTDARGCLGVVGPKARDVLQELTDVDLSNPKFPWLTARIGEIAYATDVRFIRSNFQGELGWELHHPMSYNRHIVHEVLNAGQKDGIRLVGNRALNSLRIEKSYRAIYRDMSPEFTALESGLDRYLDLSKPNFTGRTALLQQKQEGVERLLVTMKVESGDGGANRHAGVYLDNKVIGRITSSGYSHALGTDLALAFAQAPLAKPGTKLEVAVLGEKRRAEVVEESPYDPQHKQPQM